MIMAPRPRMLSRRTILGLAATLSSIGIAGEGAGEARADERGDRSDGAMGGAEPAAAAYRPSSEAARRGAARFETAHLVPGAAIDLGRVDRDDPAARVVALTLDDGPASSELDMIPLLKAADARVTFFAVGRRVAGRADITRALVDAGHEIGCHSFSHPMMGTLSGTERDDEFSRSIDALAKVGVRPAWFRPPFGDWDDDLVRRASRFGMGTITWTVDSRDWKAGETAVSVARRAERGLDAGAVLLAHGTKPITLAALPEILAEGGRMGLRFVTVGEWFATMGRLAVSG